MFMTIIEVIEVIVSIANIVVGIFALISARQDK